MSAQELLDELRGLAGRASDLEPAFWQVADDFLDVAADTVASQGAAVGAPWEPLAASTLTYRQRRGLGTDPLRYDSPDGGRIVASLTDPSSAWHVRRITGQDVTVGTELGIAVEQHQGSTTRIRWGPRAGETFAVPARPLVVVSDTVRQRWSELLGRHVAGTPAGGFGL